MDTRAYIKEEELKEICRSLASRISEDYKGEKLLVVGILKGAFVFMSDLVREIDLDIEIDFMAVSSYGNSSKTSGIVNIIKDLSSDITGKNVLIIEDIIDTGLTLSYLSEYLRSRKAKTIEICTLLDKKTRRKTEINAKYIGREIDDYFVVGYGIDFAEKYRNLPYVAIYTGDEY